MAQLVPLQPVPDLDLPLAGGGSFKLPESDASLFTMLVFYRGFHCPICKGQLNELKGMLGNFSEAGVRSVAISMDGEDRANRAKQEWDLPDLDIAYDLSEDEARTFGLYITSAIHEKEPRIFCEPGLFLIKPDLTLYGLSVQSMPFSRPAFADILPGLKYVRDHGYPARGTVT